MCPITVTLVIWLSHESPRSVTVSHECAMSHDCHMTCITQECNDPCCNATVCSLREGAKCYTHEPCCQNCQVSVPLPPDGTPLEVALVHVLFPLQLVFLLVQASRGGVSRCDGRLRHCGAVHRQQWRGEVTNRLSTCGCRWC